MTNKALKAVIGTFFAYPQEPIIHVTDDGQTFLHSKRNDAQNHQARIAPGKALISVRRKDFTKLVKEISALSDELLEEALEAWGITQEQIDVALAAGLAPEIDGEKEEEEEDEANDLLNDENGEEEELTDKDASLSDTSTTEALPTSAPTATTAPPNDEATSTTEAQPTAATPSNQEVTEVVVAEASPEKDEKISAKSTEKPGKKSTAKTPKGKAASGKGKSKDDKDKTETK